MSVNVTDANSATESEENEMRDYKEHTRLQYFASDVEFLLVVMLAAGVFYLAYAVWHLNIIMALLVAFVWFVFALWCRATGIEGGIGGLANFYNDWKPLMYMRRPAPLKSIGLMAVCMVALFITFLAVLLWGLPAMWLISELILVTVFFCPFASVIMERWD